MNSASFRLLEIAVCTLVAGVGSVWLAALLASRRKATVQVQSSGHYLLSLAAGALLATAFLHLLPEAFESSISPSILFGVLLGGLVLFFLLDKAELWHHGHEHSGSDQLKSASGHASHAHEQTDEHVGRRNRAGAWSALFGDSVHCFSDGLLIASAFVADSRLGLVAAVAVLVHEVPHHIGDLALIRQTSGSARAAAIKVALAGSVTTVGGLIGFVLVNQLNSWIPYFLVLAGSSFVYVALADLIPQLQTHLKPRQAGLQVAYLAAGIALVAVVSHIAEPEASASVASAPAHPLVGEIAANR